MKIFLGLLLVGVSALADQAPDSGQGKPAAIQDGAQAQEYIETALYQYLDKPPYLFIRIFFYDLTREPLQCLIRSHFAFHL